ncbi:hypothetical protein [Tateyamaria sp.]|uniref:hypothetical protein n=1 Tax=Tateyamaria sp. TaxID=1929288 RepID=UPI003B20BEF3
MALTLSKTPLLIAAMATAVTLTSFGPASAKAYWASADAEAVEVIQAGFKVKTYKFHKFHAPKHYHGHKHHSLSKKKHVSKKHLKKKLILKKLF